MTSLRRPRDVSEERQQDVGRAHLLELHIRPYGDVLVTSAEDVLKTSVGDAHRTSFADVFRRSSGHNFVEWVATSALSLSLSLSICSKIAFGPASSFCCLLKSIAINL